MRKRLPPIPYSVQKLKYHHNKIAWLREQIAKNPEKTDVYEERIAYQENKINYHRERIKRYKNT